MPDVDFFIYMYVKKEAALSSQIEGTKATLIDLVKKEARVAASEIASDVDEIENYINAMRYGIKRLKTLPLSLRLIREIHKVLMHGVQGQYKTPGEFRTSQTDLEKFMHDERIKLPVLIKAGLMHAQFESIHPFLDGNGRTGRLLITFYLYKENILMRPLLYLSEYFKRYRNDYYDRLNAYTKNGIEQWLKFFLEGVYIVSLKAVSTAKKITSLREKHIEAVAHFGRNAKTGLKLLNALYATPLVNTKSVAKITGLASKATVHALIDKFLKAGILYEMTGRERNQQFVYKDYLRQFSEEKYNQIL